MSEQSAERASRMGARMADPSFADLVSDITSNMRTPEAGANDPAPTDGAQGPGSEQANGGAREAETAATKLDPQPQPREPEPEETRDHDETAAKDGTDAEEQSGTDFDRLSIDDFADASGRSRDDLEAALFVEVKDANGEMREVSVAELRNGYRWNAANTQRSQEIAEQRKALDARFQEIGTIHEQASSVLASQFEAVESAEKALEEQLSRIDWDALRARADGSYADTFAQAEAARKQIAAQRSRLEAARESVAGNQAKLREQYMAEAIPKAREQLMEMVPEWRDEEVRAREGQALHDFAIEHGFSADEYNACIDPRILKMVRLAWLGSQQLAKNKAARAKVADVPRLELKPGRRRKAAEVEAEERAKLTERAVSGSRRDLAAAILRNMHSGR